MDNYCFVIQPFDNGQKYDKRYSDILKPALEEMKVKPYRVDQDNTVNILIESIEKNILSSRFCLADITTDNPNVWYEVGFAIASGKDVVLICSNERQTNYPFDIRHRKVINYSVDSTSDFAELKKQIQLRIKAILEKPINEDYVCKNDTQFENKNITERELLILGVILENQTYPGENIEANSLKKRATNVGIDGIWYNLSVRELIKKKLIIKDQYYDNDYLTVIYQLTEQGEDFMLGNSDKLSEVINIISESKKKPNNYFAIPEGEEIPF